MNNDEVEQRIRRAENELIKLRSYEPKRPMVKMCPENALSTRNQKPKNSPEWLTWDEIYKTILEQNQAVDRANREREREHAEILTAISFNEQIIATLRS